MPVRSFSSRHFPLFHPITSLYLSLTTCEMRVWFPHWRHGRCFWRCQKAFYSYVASPTALKSTKPPTLKNMSTGKPGWSPPAIALANFALAFLIFGRLLYSPEILILSPLPARKHSLLLGCRHPLPWKFASQVMMLVESHHPNLGEDMKCCLSNFPRWNPTSTEAYLLTLDRYVISGETDSNNTSVATLVAISIFTFWIKIFYISPFISTQPE